MDFTSLELPEPVRQGIREAGFVTATPIQEAALPLALKGKDVAGQSQTGTGKTAAFLIAAFTRLLRTPAPAPAAGGATPRVLIIAPTRELTVQIESDARLLGRFTPFRILAVYGGIDYAKDFIAEWKGDGLIDPCFAPHAPYTVDRSKLEIIRDEAEGLDVDIMMHSAEMDFENKQYAKSHGSVLRYLDSIEGFLSPRLLAAHMLYVDDADIELARERGLRVAHCPSSNAKSGRLICPAWRMTKAGIPLGLATDGPLSGNGMDMQGVLGLFPKMQKVREGRRDILTAREALRAATLGGAEALRLGDATGSLEAGKSADFIIVDADDFNMQPVYDWYATAVYAMRPHNVESVFVGGRMIVDGGLMTGYDQDEVKGRMKEIRGSCSAFISGIAERLSAG